ncbi:MAG: hypothetical protein WC334_04885 [Kiritimatiellales bacterium]
MNTKRLVLILLLYALSCRGQIVCEPWAAVDGLGRTLPGAEECGPPREGRFIGIFYFLWLGGHEQQGLYNITEILKQPPEKQQWGPKGIFHWWDQPRFGYYLSSDEWVIAKHAQMLSDAGVDVVIFDVTNGYTYEKEYLKLCEVYRGIRANGGKTPQISFLFNSKSKEITEKVYQDFYAKNLYPELWFHWKGKPLLMTDPEGLSQEILDFFTIRRSWAYKDPKGWFGDGKDKWPWIDLTPQAYGWHENKRTAEFVPVSTASHPVNSVGRSHKDGKQPPPEKQNPDIGIYFQEQWDRALRIDPEFIFITGWNEWVAQRSIVEKDRPFADGAIKAGDTWFIDQYTREYSRDIEPMRGGYEDNYYCQMVSNIRKFKGVRELEFPESGKITVDGNMEDWKDVAPEYRDDTGDTRPRNHPGYASAGPYTNRWGRNDIVSCKAACDGDNVYFYVKTAEEMQFDRNDPCGMNLLLRVDGASGDSREGFQFRINRQRFMSDSTSLDRFQNGEWTRVEKVPYFESGCEIELAVPRNLLSEKIKPLEIEFKWIDNMPEPLNVLDFMDHGDAAPNSRFRYIFED